MQEYLLSKGIDHHRASAYHPSSNGLVERVNKTLKSILGHYVNKHGNNWDEWLPYANFAYNTAYQETIRAPPFLLVYGRDPLFPTDMALSKSQATRIISSTNYKNTVMENLTMARRIAAKYIESAQKNQIKQYNKKHHSVTYEVGQLVLLNIPGKESEKAFARKWRGPLVVLQKMNSNNFLVSELHPDPSGRVWSDTVNVQRLKPNVKPPCTLEDLKQRGTAKEKYSYFRDPGENYLESSESDAQEDQYMNSNDRAWLPTQQLSENTDLRRSKRQPKSTKRKDYVYM